jgi:hypothetical protein
MRIGFFDYGAGRFFYIPFELVSRLPHLHKLVRPRKQIVTGIEVSGSNPPWVDC